MIWCSGGVGALHRGWGSDGVKCGLEWCRALFQDTRRYRPAWKEKSFNVRLLYYKNDLMMFTLQTISNSVIIKLYINETCFSFNR